MFQAKPTLEFDQAATKSAQAKAREQVPDVLQRFLAGDLIVRPGEFIDEKRLQILTDEYEAFESTVGIGAWARNVTCASGAVDPTLLPVVSTNDKGVWRTGDRFHFNWAVPSGAGKCYQVLIQTIDGSTVMVGSLSGTPVQEAYFRTK